MIPTDTTFSEQDEAAFQYCLRGLKDDAEITYKEIRREARASDGVLIKRHVWTAARRKLGLIPDASDEPQAPAPERPRQDPDRRSSYDAPYHQRRPPQRSQEFQPRPRGEPERPDRGYSSDPPRRPAWATPAPYQTPRTPSPPPRAPGGSGDSPSGSTPFDDVLDPQSGRSTVTPPRRNSVEFCVAYLETRREASFQEVRAAGEREGYTIYPATFGRAQAVLGIVEADPPVQIHRAPPPPPPPPPAVVAPPKPVAASPPPASPTPRSSARPESKRARPDSLDGLDPAAGLQAFLAAYGKIEEDRTILRRALEQMLEAVEQALQEP